MPGLAFDGRAGKALPQRRTRALTATPTLRDMGTA